MDKDQASQGPRQLQMMGGKYTSVKNVVNVVIQLAAEGNMSQNPVSICDARVSQQWKTVTAEVPNSKGKRERVRRGRRGVGGRME